MLRHAGRASLRLKGKLMRTSIMLTLALTLVPVLTPAGIARANTQYNFSGAACQPERPSDYAFASTTSSGLGSTDPAPFPATDMFATCPVTGLESPELGQLELRVRVVDNSAAGSVSGSWHVLDLNLATIFVSATRHSCAAANGCASATPFTGLSTLRWSGFELHPFIFSNYASYVFRARIPGRCVNETCGGISRVSGYWVTHNNP
jgi:hypothetical protein